MAVQRKTATGMLLCRTGLLRRLPTGYLGVRNGEGVGKRRQELCHTEQVGAMPFAEACTCRRLNAQRRFDAVQKQVQRIVVGYCSARPPRVRCGSVCRRGTELSLKQWLSGGLCCLAANVQRRFFDGRLPRNSNGGCAAVFGSAAAPAASVGCEIKQRCCLRAWGESAN